MLKVASGIFRLFVLLVVSAALIGVNVMQLYCFCCDESYLQVELLPQEKEALCDAEPCGDDNTYCILSEKESSRHDFYKIAGFSPDVRDVLPEIIFFYFVQNRLDVVLCVQEQVGIHTEFHEFVPDEPPSPELLCTYRC